MIVVSSNQIRKDGFYIKIYKAFKNPFSPDDSHYLKGIYLNSDGEFFEIDGSFDSSVKDSSYGGLKSLLNGFTKEAKGLFGKLPNMFRVSFNIKSLTATRILDDLEYSVVCTLYHDETLSIETFTRDTYCDEINNNFNFIGKFISFQQINTLTVDEMLNKYFAEKKNNFWTRLFF